MKRKTRLEASPWQYRMRVWTPEGQLVGELITEHTHTLEMWGIIFPLPHYKRAVQCGWPHPRITPTYQPWPNPAPCTIPYCDGQASWFDTNEGMTVCAHHKQEGSN